MMRSKTPSAYKYSARAGLATDKVLTVHLTLPKCLKLRLV
jgi:hypothetical protein